MSTRTYSEKEAADLFRRAAEYQATKAHPETPGLTLDELRRAAAAAGIDPDALDYALAAPPPSSHEPTRFLGLATNMHRRRFVPHALGDDAWGHTVRDLRDQFGDDGETETLGTIREWKHAPFRFSAEPVDGGTQFTADADWHRTFVPYFWLYTGCATFFSLATLGTLAAPDSTGATLVFSLFAILTLGFLLYTVIDQRSKAERVGAQFDALLDRTAQRLSTTRESERTVPASEPDTPSIDLGEAAPLPGTTRDARAKDHA